MFWPDNGADNLSKHVVITKHRVLCVDGIFCFIFSLKVEQVILRLSSLRMRLYLVGFPVQCYWWTLTISAMSQKEWKLLCAKATEWGDRVRQITVHYCERQDKEWSATFSGITGLWLESSVHDLLSRHPIHCCNLSECRYNSLQYGIVSIYISLHNKTPNSYASTMNP